MKRLLVLISVAVLFCVGFSSCKKCYSCDFGNNDVREFCSKDFPDGTEGLQMTIDAYEAQGYKCADK